jgi:ribonuclease VapC
VNSVVLDASAVLAVIRREPGYENVLPLMVGAQISCVNVSEVFCKAVSKGGSLEAVRRMLVSLPVSAVPFDEEQATIAASLYPSTHKRGVSFADRACLALGISQSAVIVTGDREWESLDLGVEVRRFR